MLTTGSLPPERREKAIEVIERNAVAQARLVDDLLDVARIITGKLRMAIEPVRIASVVRAAVETVSPAADGRGVTVTTEIDEGVGVVMGDPNRLQQAVWNLLSTP